MRISDPLFSGNTVISGSFKVSGSFNVNDNDLSTGAVGFPFSGSAAVTGSLNVTGSILLNGEEITAISTPIITSVNPTVVKESDPSYTITVTGENFDINATAVLIGNNATTITPTTSTRVSSTQMSLFFTGSTRLTGSLEPYGVTVTNGTGFSSTRTALISVNDKPVWVTESGRIGTLVVDTNITASLFISASDEEGDYPISYSLETGVLPTGLSLITSSGEITGSGTIRSGSGDIASASGTQYNLTFRATDNAGVFATKNFNILLKYPDGSTPSLAVNNLKEIANLGVTTSGLFYVKNPNVNSGTPFQVYGDMSKDGGGWMLVLMVDGSSQSAMGWTNTTVQSRNTGSPSLSTAYSILSWADYFTATSGWQWMVEATDTVSTRYTYGGIFTANGSYTINGTSASQTNISVNEWFDLSQFAENSGIGPRVPYRDTSGTQAGVALYTTYPGTSSWWGTIVQSDASYSSYKSGPWVTSTFESPLYKRLWVR